MGIVLVTALFAAYIWANAQLGLAAAELIERKSK